MKGDFSRIRFSKKREQEKNYRKVLFQQGRVLTDADWNDHIDIQEYQETRYLRDIIGKNGVPLEQKENSFKIIPIGQDRYAIGKGTIYVDGIQVQNFLDVEAFSDVEVIDHSIAQPYLPTLSIRDQATSDAVPKEPGIYLAYLDVWDRHITYLEDSDIQESALGDSDTSTRVQTVWQVKLHKLEDGEATNINPNEENKWAPWISLANDSSSSSKVLDLRIGSNNDGSLLEVVALSTQEPRKSRRQESLDPVKWEAKWQFSGDDWNFAEFDIASTHVGDLEIIYTFGIQTLNFGFRTSIRDDLSRWGRPDVTPTGGGPNGLRPIQPKLVMNAKNNLELFVISTSNNDFKIFHSKKQANSSEWKEWRPIHAIKFTKFSVILNPNDNRIEIYAIENGSMKIWYTKQKEPDSIDWQDWKEIKREVGNPEKFDEIAVGINRNKQIIIFARELRQGKIWSTIRTEPDFPGGNGWRVVGNNEPGRLRSGSGSLSLQNNPKKQNRLEVFGIFSDPTTPSPSESGKIWNIFEDEQGEWNSKWKIIDENLKVVKVDSSKDKKSRVNIFAIQDGTGIVHHSYVENTEDLLNCEGNIPSWESKIKPSISQLKARTVPQTPLPDDQCMLPEQAGYRRLENQLYRIEIHEPKSGEKKATFKYSRDNGTVCSKILNISGEKITVESVGRDRLLGFNSGQWVEIIDDLHELWGIPSVLVRLKGVEGTDLIFDSNTLIPPGAPVNNVSFPERFNPKVRRWDSQGSLKVDIPTENDGFLKIEDGIEIKFSSTDNVYRTGDYWTIPARTLKADVEWPKDNNGIPEFVDIEGIEHHYVKLAFLQFSADKLELIADCRDFFPPINMLDDLSPQPKPVLPKPVICWIHGTISEVEFPERLRLEPAGSASGIKHGTGSTYRQNSSINWFHFPITISSPVDPDKKISIQKIFILFDSNNDAKINQIDIYDGRDKKTDFAPLELSGDHGKSPDESNTFSLEPGIIVNQGIGISIKVSFRTNGAFGEINFRSVGVQLKIE